MHRQVKSSHSLPLSARLCSLSSLFISCHILSSPVLSCLRSSPLHFTTSQVSLLCMYAYCVCMRVCLWMSRCVCVCCIMLDRTKLHEAIMNRMRCYRYVPSVKNIMFVCTVLLGDCVVMWCGMMWYDVMWCLKIRSNNDMMFSILPHYIMSLFSPFSSIILDYQLLIFIFIFIFTFI